MPRWPSWMLLGSTTSARTSTSACRPGPPDAFPRFARAWCATPGRQDGPFDFAAEIVFGTLHTSTHIDALVHVQKDGRIFGGDHDSDVRTDRGFTRHGVETIPPLLTRGLVLDVAALHDTPALPDGYEVGTQDLQGALDRGATRVRRGDVVLVRTGKIRDYHDKAATFHDPAPGVGPDAAIWLYEQGMAALAVDTAGSEATPFPDRERTTHVAMLVERGVHLIENVMLDVVCADGVARGPVRLPAAARHRRHGLMGAPDPRRVTAAASLSELTSALVCSVRVASRGLGRFEASTTDAACAGRAVTVRGTGGDNLAIYHGLAAARPGDILVVALGGSTAGRPLGWPAHPRSAQTPSWPV